VLRVTGETLIALGLLVLVFTAFELWGTGLLQRSTQRTITTLITQYLPAPLHHLPVGPPTPLPASPAPVDGSWIGTLSIPTIHVNQVIVQGTETTDLRVGPGHYRSTPLPGEAGNVAIAGHRTTWAAPFRHLDALTGNDPIVITTPRGHFLYRVTAKFVVDPTDLRVVAPTTANVLTLTTCNPPYSAATRLVIRARLAAVQPANVVITVPVRRVVTRVLTTLVRGHQGWWPVLSNGTLLVLLVTLGRRGVRRVRHPVLLVLGLLLVALPLLWLLCTGVAWLLPAGI
jgi:LPXTG-site transpeptidase (sortase) family protein